VCKTRANRASTFDADHLGEDAQYVGTLGSAALRSSIRSSAEASAATTWLIVVEAVVLRLVVPACIRRLPDVGTLTLQPCVKSSGKEFNFLFF